jgi:hypothetical protein
MRFFNWGLPGLAAVVVIASLALGGAPERPLAIERSSVIPTSEPGGSSEPDGTVPVVPEFATPEPSPTPDPPKPAAPPPEPKPVLTSCDANIRIKAPQTTCAFAQNVFYGYWLNNWEPGVFADEPGIPAYSPAAGTTFTVRCTGVQRIVCRAGDGGYVTFPSTAVAAYTVGDADEYAATHELGDVPPPPDGTVPVEPTPDGSGDECDPNYSGCLDPGSLDYDCEGGTGDGPDYTGRVDVLGDDPFELDRDGDGVACDAEASD